MYNEQGYLKAQITAGPLDIDGDTGVLPVTIVEGPRAQIANVSWAGVPDTRLDAVQKAAAVETPTPFVNSEVNEARRRIELHYRTEGFNTAEVEIQTKVADDNTVTLLFEVTEGPQQVLQEVVTTGNEITRSKVITQALRFEVGKPANLDDWAQARKRLYDTNVFRQVDIQTVPMGEVVDGVQPVKAQVSVVEYPAWALRYGTQLEGERQDDIEEFTSTRNLGLVGGNQEPQPVRPGADAGPVRPVRARRSRTPPCSWRRHACSAGARDRACMASTRTPASETSRA